MIPIMQMIALTKLSLSIEQSSSSEVHAKAA
jgi:hypothetical protein